MRGHATVVAERANGRPTRCTTLRSSPPISLRETRDALYLVGSAGGPVGGDELQLDVVVGASAHLAVRSVAAQVVLPGPRLLPSRSGVMAAVGPAASLDWSPEPTVLASGCDHHASARITLERDATLVWRDEVVLGRSGEPGGSLLQRLAVDREGRPLLRNDLALGPRWPGSAGPAGVAGARVVTTLVVVGVQVDLHDVDGTRAAAFQLGADAVLVTVLADSVDAARGALGHDRVTRTWAS